MIDKRRFFPTLHFFFFVDTVFRSFCDPFLLFHLKQIIVDDSLTCESLNGCREGTVSFNHKEYHDWILKIKLEFPRFIFYSIRSSKFNSRFCRLKNML